MSGGVTVLLVLEHVAQGPDELAASLLAAGVRVARKLGGSAVAVQLPEQARFCAETCARALAERVRSVAARAVFLGDSDFGRELAPRLAHELGTAALLGCSGVTVRGEEALYHQPVYGGWLEERISFFVGRVEVATLAAGAGGGNTPRDAELQQVPVRKLELPTTSDKPAIRLLERIPPDFRTVDLVHARRIVSAGVGADDDELLASVKRLAELLQGSIGTTRPMVDGRRLPKERMVGQTGRRVAPDLYLALGLSGSPHHVAGIQGAGTIMAVNRDPRAPIFQVADVGYVADLHQVLPTLVRLIEEWSHGH